MRRTKATLIYLRTGNLRAVRLLLGPTRIESTVRYLGVEVVDALDLAERIVPRSARWWLRSKGANNGLVHRNKLHHY